jgi:outer membrane protein W
MKVDVGVQYTSGITVSLQTSSGKYVGVANPLVDIGSVVVEIISMQSVLITTNVSKFEFHSLIHLKHFLYLEKKLKKENQLNVWFSVYGV